MSQVNNTVLEEIFKVKQVEYPPESLRGILQTKNYDTFEIYSDTGYLLHQFKGAKLANKCLPGDHVEWINGQCLLELRDDYPPIVGTIELTNKSKYGLTSRGIPIYLFTPYNKSYPHFIVGCSEKDVSRNLIALIAFGDWNMKSKFGTFPRGLLKQIIGPSGDYDAEKQALIWQSCPYLYPKFDYCPTLSVETTRVALGGFTFNIDPPGCKDVDDVFTFEPISENQWIVTITISDVACYVEDCSAVDIMASLIGQTLYDNKGAIIRPMLPAAFSEKVCSLLPGKESNGVSLQFRWTGKEIRDILWFESRLETNKSYSYEEFQTADTSYKQPLADIASYLAKEIITDSHKWVEQMMIFYNKEAGRKLKDAGQGILRKHSEPNMERLERFKQCATVDLEKLAYSSAEYCLADDINTVHHGLNSATYAHTTSPIRRYADLVNQRILKQLICNQTCTYIIPQTMYDMNRREKAIKHFARDLDFLEAVLSGIQTKGIILEKIKQDTHYKIILYIPEWKRTISTNYKYLSENSVLSRDETICIDITLFREVNVQYTYNMNARNWKERMVIHFA